MFNFRKQASPYNVYFFGRAEGGSWQIRGEQIASTRRNWSCGEKINPASLKNNDIFVAVKRLSREDAETVKNAGKTLVYDVIDSWHSPEGAENVKSAEDARKFFAAKWSGLPIDSAIFACQRMHSDLASLVPHSTHIYHHYYPKLKPKTPARKIKRIGYQGRRKFLGNWEKSIAEISKRAGLDFVVNPPSLMDLDIGFIARGEGFNGFMEQNYKSNVKLANLMACGVPPLILSGGASYHETWQREETFFSSETELETKLNVLLGDDSLRHSIRNDLLEKSKQFQLSVITSQYEKYFMSMLKR